MLETEPEPEQIEGRLGSRLRRDARKALLFRGTAAVPGARRRRRVRRAPVAVQRRGAVPDERDHRPAPGPPLPRDAAGVGARAAPGHAARVPVAAGGRRADRAAGHGPAHMETHMARRHGIAAVGGKVYFEFTGN